MTILVVDDDEVTLKLLKEVLEKEGYAVQLAQSGEEAVRLYRRNLFPWCSPTSAWSRWTAWPCCAR